MTYVAHWWSVDGARLAYLSINNSATPVMEIPHFLGSLYPSNMVFPYPKVINSLEREAVLVPIWDPVRPAGLKSPAFILCLARRASMKPSCGFWRVTQ